MELFHHQWDLLLTNALLQLTEGVDVIQFPALEDIFVGFRLRLAPFSGREVTQRSALQIDDNIPIPIIFVDFSPQGIGRIGVVNLCRNVVWLRGIRLERQQAAHCVGIPMLCLRSVFE